MTTETRKPAGQTTRRGGSGVVLGAAGATLALGVGVAVLGGLVSGRPAALGALVGTAIVVCVVTFGSLSVDLVAGAMPMASLMVAITTYTLQLVLLLVAFAALERSGALGSTLDRTWLGGAVIGGTMVWLAAHVVLTVRRRIPVYDLPVEQPSAGPEAGER